MKKEIAQVAVEHISVEELFGVYSYKLPNTSEKGIEKLLIIYGDNGTGKTTILKLFFYLLSTRDKSGYKTKIAETRFKKFVVQLKNGIEIGAKRECSTCGTFTYYIAKNNEILKSIELKADSDNSIQLDAGSKEDIIYQEILNYIRNLNITTFYLSDDRKVLNSITSKNANLHNSPRFFINESDIIFSKGLERNEIKKILNERRLDLEATLERLIDWIRN